MALLAHARGDVTTISKRVERAIYLLILHGADIATAAQSAGLKDKSLRAALAKPHVKAFRLSVQRAHIDAEGERSLAVLVRLRDSAASEHVQLQAAQHLAALAGIRPVEEHHHRHDVTVTPGYVIDLSGPRTPVIEGLTDQHSHKYSAIDVDDGSEALENRQISTSENT